MGRIYSKRYIAQIDIQAATPLAVSSGIKDSLTDSLVIRDVNGLPYIPGTSLCGIIRHSLNDETAKDLFGFNETREKRKERLYKDKKAKENIDEGSKIMISSAHIIDEYGNVIETLEDKENNLTMDESIYLRYFEKLPVRQHVRINNKGVSEEYGKFNEEVVFKGTRFRFEIEMLYGRILEDEKTGKRMEDDYETLFEQILCELQKDTLRIGSGSRKGFGEIEIIKCVVKSYNLKSDEDRNAYLRKTSSLNSKILVGQNEKKVAFIKDNTWSTYEIKLKPDDFFLFGSGFGDKEANVIPVKEGYFSWQENKPVYKTDTILIPGSSVKGALSHRLAYHHNRLTGIFCDEIDIDRQKDFVGENNQAVQIIFGYTGKDQAGEYVAQRGNVIISDLIVDKRTEVSKILNHVTIDRYTGGAIDGALFSEKVVYGNNEVYTLVLKVNEHALKQEKVEKAFHSVLIDVASGMLPLGGGVNRGHGIFTGEVIKDGVVLYRY